MKKLLLGLLLCGIILTLLGNLGFAETNINYRVTGDTGVLWDERMLTQFPDVVYIHVGHDVDKFFIQVDSTTYGPLDLTVIAPNGETVYDYYSMCVDNHNMRRLVSIKKYGTGIYTAKVFQAHTANIGYVFTLKGPKALGPDELEPTCGSK